MKFAIMGTGVMGCGWITQCAISGHDVHCYDSNPDSVAAVAQQCEKLADTAARKFKIDDPGYGSKTIKKITPYENKKDFIKAAQNCDVFFEVIFEDMNLKCAVLSAVNARADGEKQRIRRRQRKGFLRLERPPQPQTAQASEIYHRHG